MANKELMDRFSPEERILAAAAEEFASRGFFGARTQAIADAAGVNKAMLHYYFRTKENLYSRVIAGALRRILDQVGQAWLGQDSIEFRLEKVVDAYMDNYERNPGFLKIILREFVDGGERLRKVLRDMKDMDPLASGVTLPQIIDRIAREIGLSLSQTTHLIINVVGMCAISFVSPLLLEALGHFKVTDLKLYLKDRRTAVKSMTLAYVNNLVNLSKKE
ncbi:MAG: TetR/AcrR family transcriptional regulator [Deltaproteobacteria bacterium]